MVRVRRNSGTLPEDQGKFERNPKRTQEIGGEHPQPRADSHCKIHSSHNDVKRQRQIKIVGVHLCAILMQNLEPQGPQWGEANGPQEHRSLLVLYLYQTQRRTCFQLSGKGPLRCSWMRCVSLRITIGHPSQTSISCELCGSTHKKMGSMWYNQPHPTSSPRSMCVAAHTRFRMRCRRMRTTGVPRVCNEDTGEDDSYI